MEVLFTRGDAAFALSSQLAVSERLPLFACLE